MNVVNYTFALLKVVYAILLLLLLSIQGLMPIWVIGNWKINQSRIANTLCENRNRPSMHCNGKCHLRKQLNKLHNDTGKDKNKLANNNLEVSVYLPCDFIIWNFASRYRGTNSAFFFFNQLIPPSDWIDSFLKPPGEFV